MTDELPFKVVRGNGTDEVLARAMNLCSDCNRDKPWGAGACLCTVRIPMSSLIWFNGTQRKPIP
jgi:hypothetical protein